MFMGPLRETKVWSTRSVDGVHRFLGRAWRLYDAHATSPALEAEPSAEQLRVLHSTIKRVTGALRMWHCQLLRTTR
jgi:leucyl-tRNA synthetase